MVEVKAKLYTVTEINSLVKVALEENLPCPVTVYGQISDCKHHSSGHCYFELKDEDARLACVMWNSNFRKLKFEPQDGLAVIATGSISLYVPHGKCQLYVEAMVPAGVGALQLVFEQLVKKLQAEGLFDDVHKKPLPAYPQRIAVLTSESGAALWDIVDSIYNRWPVARLFFYPVPVQGPGAAEAIARAIRDVNQRNTELKLDLLIIGRGGGSLQDLWAFNEEVLARAIFKSQIPVISAVGHEVDVTIADLVADARASTPTKAGVIAVPDMRKILEELAFLQTRLGSNTKAALNLAGQRLSTVLASAVFKNPLLPVLNAGQKLDDLAGDLQSAANSLLVALREKLARFYEQLSTLEPHRLIGRQAAAVSSAVSRLGSAMEALLSRLQLQLTARENLLAGLNPKAVLRRGYTITTNLCTARIVTACTDVELDDLLVTELAEQNLIESKVTKKQNKGRK
jgi:exodeoxyribonuclease VII large subunit